MVAWSGLYDDVNADGYSILSNTDAIKSSVSRQIAKLARKNRVLREVLRETTNGNFVGVTLSSPLNRIKNKEADNSFGGKRTIEVVDDLNTLGVYATHGHPVRDLLDANPAPIYPIDKSGNGGGGKAGYI